MTYQQLPYLPDSTTLRCINGTFQKLIVGPVSLLTEMFFYSRYEHI